MITSLRKYKPFCQQLLGEIIPFLFPIWFKLITNKYWLKLYRLQLVDGECKSSRNIQSTQFQSHRGSNVNLRATWQALLNAAAKSLQSYPTLCDPIDGSPPGSPVLGILQARTLEWVAISFSNAWKWKVKVKSLSRVRLLATPWTAAQQAPPSMGFSRQEFGVGCHCLLRLTWLPLLKPYLQKRSTSEVLGIRTSLICKFFVGGGRGQGT